MGNFIDDFIKSNRNEVSVEPIKVVKPRKSEDIQPEQLKHRRSSSNLRKFNNKIFFSFLKIILL
jgi:uncharacterized protein YnzC (UPF0291/DUF896 family)